MINKITNLVFEGGGVLGIAYLGVLDFLYEHGILQNIQRVAGTSAGAITACVTSFNLPFDETKKISDTLDYSKIPQKDTHPDLRKIPHIFKNNFLEIFEEDINEIYRLTKHYGLYSSEYLYKWLKKQIAFQFDSSKKLPPYTFADFKNTIIHKNKRPFLDLYVIGTDISTKHSRVFSYETTPKMEVATAVRISMSIPLFFESIEININDAQNKSKTHVFSDGGVMRNYPINIFDSFHFSNKLIKGVNYQTLGARFKKKTKYSEINNLIEYIVNLIESYMNIQQDMYNHNPQDKFRSIKIDTKDISFIDFNISPNDEKYNFLYQQGYMATKKYFKNKMHFSRLY